jgi:hypothetical protein
MEDSCSSETLFEFQRGTQHYMAEERSRNPRLTLLVTSKEIKGKDKATPVTGHGSS